MTVKDGPTKRILHVLDLLQRNGPMTLAEVTRHCSFSRAAVWRALDTLREMGWVRMRLGDYAFVILAEKTMPRPAQHVDFPGALELVSHMQFLEKEHGAHVCIAGFGGGTGLRVLESTERNDYGLRAISLVQDGLALAAQAMLTKVDLVLILRAYVPNCPPYERRMIEDGRHAEQLSTIRKRGYFLSEDHVEMAFPLSLHGQVMALRLRAKTESPIAARALIGWMGATFP